MMSESSRYERICNEFQRLVPLAAAQRSQALDQLRIEDSEFAEEVAQLLAADGAAEGEGFLASEDVSEDYTPDEEVDFLCDQFERELQEGQCPSIERYLDRIDETRKPVLLYWLLTVQLQTSDTPDQKREMLDRCRAKLPQYRSAIGAAESAAMGKTTSTLPTIPGYTVKRRVDQGGQGEVFLAIQDRTGQDVAIKLVSNSQLERIPQHQRLQVIARLEQEIRTAAGLNHPNIVKVFDAGECEAGFYFVMQWVKGGSLADRTTLSQTDAAKIIRSVADALAEAHASDVLHLDVKPHNILIDETTGQPLLADFGLARLSRETAKSNTIAGTIGYMAPEQAQGGALDVRADVYGLGATFYKLLTGKNAYRDVSIPYQAGERQAWAPEAPRAIRRDINPELEQICMKCLQFEAKSRFQSCKEIAAALDRFALTEDGRRIAQMATRTLVTGPLFFFINLTVMLQIIGGWADDGLVWELPTWMTMFSMYGVVFFIFGSISKLDRHSPEHLAIESLWAVWLAKLFAAMAIAGSLRLIADSAREAMLMCYPMFSALTGLVLATIAPRYWRFLYLLAIVSWLASLVLMLTVISGEPIAPAIYGGMASGLAVIWGMKLRQLSREQGPTGAVELSPTVDFPRENA